MCDECTEQAWEMSAEDERERILDLLEPFMHKALMLEVTINDCRALIAEIKEETDERNH